ncbi:MAG TPA: PQQ-dependent sugar dehydrogenase [Ktedonobacterales bacterium]
MATPTTPAPQPPSQPPARRQRLTRRGIVVILIVALLAIAAGFVWQHREFPLALIRGQIHPLGGSTQTTTLHLPPGFTADVYASGLSAPRFLTFGPDGVLYVAESANGRVTALPVDPATGKAARHVTVASDLEHPTSLAFAGDVLNVGETSRVTQMTIGADMRASNQRHIITDLPNSGQHITRTALIGPDGKLYVSIGSSCNVCDETDPHRASVWVYNPDGSGGHRYAYGLRNAVGMAVSPVTHEIWVTNMGRDLLGDNIPPDTIYALRAGANYGWPTCHAGNIIDPDMGKPGDCDGVEQPLVKIQAHSAPLGLAFYSASAFPVSYRGLFVAYHGSWNRSVPTGYKVVYIPLDSQGRVAGPPQDFATGWLHGGSASGRPVGLAVGPDGALYLSDDAAGIIYRISYSG